MPNKQDDLFDHTVTIKHTVPLWEVVSNMGWLPDEIIMMVVDELLTCIDDADLYDNWAKKIHDEYAYREKESCK